MNRRTRILVTGSGLIVFLLLAPLIRAAPDAWQTLQEADAPGLDRARLKALVQVLKANGFSQDAAAACLAPVAQAVRAGLPAETVLIRLEEGASKKAEASALEIAAQNRLAALQAAAGLMRDTSYAPDLKENVRLLQSTALALESGLSAAGVRQVLARGKGSQQDRIQSILEAGETMRLGQVDDPTVCQMMLDFADRNMRRSEVVRATRFVIQQNRAFAGGNPQPGAVADGNQIRSRLWGGNGALAASETPGGSPTPNAVRAPGVNPAAAAVPGASGIRGNGVKTGIGTTISASDQNAVRPTPSPEGK